MQDERKTPDERNKMTELERLRHSGAHVMATAILRLWPDAQFAAGPAVALLQADFTSMSLPRGAASANCWRIALSIGR